MANEIQYRHDSTGSTLYFTARNEAGLYYNGATFEACAAGNWVDYGIAMAEQDASYLYFGAFPAIAAGNYAVDIFGRVGASPSITDEHVGSGEMYWDGAAEVSGASAAASADGKLTTGRLAKLDAIPTDPTIAERFGSVDGYVSRIPLSPAAEATAAAASMAAQNAYTAAQAATSAATTAAGQATAANTKLPADTAARLANLDAAVSTRAAPADIPAAPDVPTVEDIGAALAAAHGAGSWTGQSSQGDGDVLVDHNYGGEDELRITAGGVGVDGATIRAYLTVEYDSGTYTVRGTATTGSDGRWVEPMMLDAGDYTLVISKPGRYAASTVEVTVA
jgi:hypothetical protein